MRHTQAAASMADSRSMDSLLTWIGAIAGALLVVAVVVAWWEHRKRLAELRLQLINSEHSRFELEERVRAVDLRLEEMSATLQTQQRDLQAAREASHRRTTLDHALQRMSRAPADAGNSAWPDTLPMVQATDVPQAAQPIRPPIDLHPH
jgi:hypothetical protein